jgi:hypothetical protein
MTYFARSFKGLFIFSKEGNIDGFKKLPSSIPLAIYPNNPTSNPNLSALNLNYHSPN